ncbi:MAG TPA: patatin-like phospholipase family protein [Cyclobacteriaceae bacterium]|nr:patatin-like phospholipase family protein [Cyclobacteriaceae bacterium]HRF33666.1 patatin-like phospholipase family protein [Cyclobacteriaceae bacterium]
METSRFRILTLNGGGSKGVYTLGVLNELERLLGSPLHHHFDLIYGTSTGAIIASLLSLGKDIKFIEKKYFELIPDIMGCWTKAGKSKVLKNHAESLFENKKFDSFLTKTGIVAMNYEYQRPLIFKSHVDAAYGLKASFEPGFGLTIAEAVQASCAAYPVFNKVKLETSNQGTQEAIDGGFVANNPTLFAIMDANKALKIPEESISVLNVGVGNYVEKPINFSSKILSKLNLVQLVGRVLNANTNTTEILTKFLYPNLNIVIVNETFAQPEYGTNMVETNTDKLKLLYRLGRESFAKNEKQITQLFA